MKYSKIAIISNDEELTDKVINKLVLEGYVTEGSMTRNMLLYNYYIPDFDVIVSPLALEVHYPSYEDNKIYGDEFLKM